jgi:hypothetical protein
MDAELEKLPREWLAQRFQAYEAKVLKAGMAERKPRRW